MKYKEMYTYFYIHVLIYYVHICMHIYICVCVCVCMYVCMYVYIYIYIYIYIYDTHTHFIKKSSLLDYFVFQFSSHTVRFLSIIYFHTYVYIYFFVHVCVCSPMVGEIGFQSQVELYLKIQKLVLDASVPNTQHYKVQIKENWSNTRKVWQPSPHVV